MPMLNIHLAVSGRVEKLPAGPIVSPRPGPTLEMAVIAPDMEVMKSSPVADRPSARTMKHRA